MLQDTTELLAAAVAETLDALDLTPADTAAKRLATHYAQVIDTATDKAWALRWIGPLLLDALEQLGATPAARARLQKGGGGDAPQGKLGQLRAARRA